MSWDFKFVMPCCGCMCADAGNLTFNLHDMMKEANIAPRNVLDGKKGDELAIILRSAWSDLIKDPEKFKKFSPPNGWGSYDGLLTWIQETVDMAERYPKSIFKVSA